MTTDPLYGQMPRTTLEANYIPITLAQCREAYRSALAQETAPPHMVLVEEADGRPAYVHLLPASATPWGWRQWWRLQTDGEKEPCA